jgi:hypothetical protein
MSRLSRIVGLPASKYLLFIRASIVVALVRIGLWVLPFSLLRRLVIRLVQGSAPRETVASIAWAVRAASRRTPCATCLTQALAAHILLAKAGHHSRVEIGVSKDQRGCFEAHAWTVCDGAVVVGGSELNKYAPLITWEGESLLAPVLLERSLDSARLGS